jgi:hypothetical protein
MKPERKKTPDLPQVADSEKASSLQLSDNLVLNVQLSHYRMVSSYNKTDRYDINEILLKVTLNTITLTPFTLICV